MNGDAIQVVSKALRDFLKDALNAQDIPGDVHVGPLDDDDAKAAIAMLFLYRVAVNADLRSSEHRVLAADPDAPPVVYENSLPLDLYYLLTVGTAKNGPELDPMAVLGHAMQALNGTPYLVGLPVQGETVRLSLDPISSEEMSRIWTLFPTANYRTSIVYLATPIWIDPVSAPIPAGPVVREPHRFGRLAGIQP